MDKLLDRFVTLVLSESAAKAIQDAVKSANFYRLKAVDRLDKSCKVCWRTQNIFISGALDSLSKISFLLLGFLALWRIHRRLFDEVLLKTIR